VIVCTPQPVALADAHKAVNMFKTTKTQVLGLIENMAGEVFGRGGARDAAEEGGIPFLGALDLDPGVRKSGDAGRPLLADEAASGPVVDALWGAIDRLTVTLGRLAKQKPRALPVRRT
jgi:ATP-binding protein involved in chromosome partitioning